MIVAQQTKNVIYIELNFRKCKWLLLGTYHPPSQPDQYYFDNLDKSLDTYSNYEKKLLVGDFNAQTTDQYLSSFLYQHELSIIVKESMCFKNVSNPSSINLILTNSALSFQNKLTISCGLSDFHKLVMTVLKTTFSKNKPREIVYRNYKYFNSQNFNDELKFVFSKENIDSCTKFNQTFLNVLNKHAPLKKKQLRANHASYVSKSMRNAIMRRSYLENVYFKMRTDKSLRAYKKQKNYCSRPYKKERKKFFNKLNPSFVNDNKSFWKTIKPFFSSKGSCGSNIKLVEKDEILQDDKKTAEELNAFFKNAVSTLDINENFSIINEDFQNFDDPVYRAIEMYKYHPSIILINQKIGNQKKFSFESVALSDVVKEINDINPNE